MNRGQLTLVARLHAEQRSRSAESQTLTATEDALARAYESIVQLVLERDSERRMRLDIEARVPTQRRGREAAMRALQQALQVLRKLKNETAERRREADELKTVLETERCAREDAEKRARGEQQARRETVRALREARSAAKEQARAFARLETRCRAMTTELRELEDALAQAEYVSYRQSLEQEKLEADLENERRARVAAENQVLTQKRAQEEALHTLSKIGSSRVWHSLRLAR